VEKLWEDCEEDVERWWECRGFIEGKLWGGRGVVVERLWAVSKEVVGSGGVVVVRL
jgi:hypothetical protein